MLAEYKTKTNLGVAVGFILQVIGRALMRNSAMHLVAMVFIILGLIFFIWGCMNYAEGKGHSKWLGFLGLFSCLGLIILVVLPDRNK